MAHKEQIARRKRELTAQLAENRQAITLGREDLTQKLQVKQVLRKLISRKPKSLFAGSAVAGLGAALFLRRPRKAKKAPQSTRVLLLGWILSLIKPTIKAWLIARAKQTAMDQRPLSQPVTPPRH